METKAYSSNKITQNPSTSKLLVNYINDLASWWFVSMPVYMLRSLARLNQVLNDKLSILLLLETFFVPWKRDYKLIGRFMGVIMRIIYIPIALLVVLIINLAYISAILIWLILPIITGFLILFGFIVPI